VKDKPVVPKPKWSAQQTINEMIAAKTRARKGAYD
jgi:hypothetical protein